MIPPGASQRRVAHVLLSLSIVAAALAAWALATGGFRVYVLGIPLSVRGAFRPTMAAILLGAAGLHLLAAWRWPVWSALGRRMVVAPALIATTAGVTVLVLGLLYGTRAAGGSDPYGYVSQATLWTQGSLKIPQPFVATMPWPNAAWTFSPLGYRPADYELIIMPTYAPGVPMLMALATLVAGHCGPFLVGPVCGAVLVLLTYRLGLRVSGPVVGLIAACCMASSPTVLFMSNWPMSDVPAATFWIASLVAALGAGRFGPLVAGLAAAVAIVIRPNLAPLAVGPALALALAGPGRVLRLATFAAGCAPGIAFVGWLFNDLYGSPLRSGYGNLSQLYSLSHPTQNIKLYSGWFAETQGPLAFAFLAAPPIALWRRGTAMAPRLVTAAFGLLVLAAYLVYAPFDNWTYLRFLLPAFPVAFVLSADVAWELSTTLGRWWRGIAMLLFGAAIVGASLTQSDMRNVLAVGADEQRFADVGAYTGTALPANALVVAQQHSGNIRYYGNRLTLRFDLLDPAWLDKALGHLRQVGYEPFILLEDWELPQFRARFTGEMEAAAIDLPPMAATEDGRVRIYRTGAAASDRSGPAVIPRTSGCVQAHASWPGGRSGLRAGG